MNESVPNSSPLDREAALFSLAVEKPLADRAAFLRAVCGEDSALRQRLEALVAAHEQPDESLAASADRHRASGTMKLEGAGEPADEAIHHRIGRYKILEKVGEGGCGVVYVAEQIEPVRRRVALKVIKLGMDTKAVVARFEAERQALALMDHPNIAKVLDAGTTDTGRPYFVMELVRGIRITEYCDQNHLATQERLDLFIKVCQAIQHAHQKGIIHRDIKPSNILVTLHDGVPVPKVIDFGIAKATEGRLTDATVYTQLHQFIGTPAYMSPEQAEMSGLDIDTRSDIYSLGVLLYELLTGRTPFDAQELMSQGIDAMRKTIREKEPARPSTKLATLQGEELTITAKRRSAETSELARMVRGDLDWIVMKCLEKDRTRRYETANGLAMDLKRHLKNEPVLARSPSAAYRFQKAFRRNRLSFTAGFAVAAALIAGIGVSTSQTFVARRAQRESETARHGEQQQRLAAESAQRTAEAEQHRANEQALKAAESQEQARRLLYAADMSNAQQALKQNNLGKARRLLDRHRPQPGEEDLRGWEWRYLWQLTRSSASMTLTNRPARGFSLSFSPDGTRLAVGWFDGRVELWDVPGRRLLRVLTKGSSRPGRVAFSPVRNLLAATSGSRAVTLYDLESGRESILWRVPDDGSWDVRDLTFSGDGSRVAIYAASARRFDAAWVINLDSSTIELTRRTVSSGDNHFGAVQLSPDGRLLFLARSDYPRYRTSIQCIDVATGQEIWESEPEKDQGLTTMALSPDGGVLASGSGYENPTIRIRDAATGRILTRLEGHTVWAGKVAFTRDGRRLISAAADQSIRIWDTSNWTEKLVLRGHADEVHSVAISEAGQLIASGSKDGDLTLWTDDGKSSADGYRLLPESLGRNRVLPLDHSRALLLPRNAPPELVDFKRDSPPQPLPELGNSANVLGWFGGRLLFCWNGNDRILALELRGSEFIPRGAVTLDSGVRPTAFTYNAKRELIAWTGTNSPVYVAHLPTRNRRIELKGDLTRIVSLLFSDDGNFLSANTGNGRSLRLWNVETAQMILSLAQTTWNTTFDTSSRVLITNIGDVTGHEVCFYDLAHPTRPPRKVPGKHFASWLAVCPNGNLVASATGGGQVRLFDPLKAELIESIHGHLNAIFHMEFSPDGKRLISSSGGREAVKLWDVATRQELLTLSGIGSTLGNVHWSADGDTILAGNPWQAWRAPSWEEIAAEEAKAPPSRRLGGQAKAAGDQP
jgi:serine/threonine protein kinase/WD40 repeat protein